VYTTSIDTNDLNFAVLRIGVDNPRKSSAIYEVGTPEGQILSGRLPLEGSGSHRLGNFRLRSIPTVDTPWAAYRSGALLELYTARNEGLIAGDMVTVCGTGQPFYSNTFSVLAVSTYAGFQTITLSLGQDPGINPARPPTLLFSPRIENCSPGSFTITNSTLYVTFSDGGPPSGRTLWLPSTATNHCLVSQCRPYTRLSLYGLTEWGGWEGVDVTGCGFFLASGCHFMGNGDCGVIHNDLGQNAIYLTNVECAANNNDGIDYLSNLVSCGGTNGAYELNCWVHDNCDDGTSPHYGARVTCVGGLYEYNRSLACVPFASSLCVMYNCTLRYNDVGVGVGGPNAFGSFCPETLTWTNHEDIARLYGCSIYGNRIGIQGSSTEGGCRGELTQCYLNNNGRGPFGGVAMNTAMYTNSGTPPEALVMVDCMWIGPLVPGPHFLQPTIVNSAPSSPSVMSSTVVEPDSDQPAVAAAESSARTMTSAGPSGPSSVPRAMRAQASRCVRLVAQQAGGNIVLSWPIGSGNYRLQWSYRPGEQARWETEPQQPRVVGDRASVTLPMSGDARFYRLSE
jgi:hypothetical protein